MVFLFPEPVATVRGVLGRPRDKSKYISFYKHCIANTLIPLCSLKSSFPLSYRQSESTAKRLQVSENSGTSGGLQDNHLPREDSGPVCLRVYTRVGVWYHKQCFLAVLSVEIAPEESEQPSTVLLAHRRSFWATPGPFSKLILMPPLNPTRTVLRSPTCTFGKPFTWKHYPEHSRQLLFEEGTWPFLHGFQ